MLRKITPTKTKYKDLFPSDIYKWKCLCKLWGRRHPESFLLAGGSWIVDCCLWGGFPRSSPPVSCAGHRQRWCVRDHPRQKLQELDGPDARIMDYIQLTSQHYKHRRACDPNAFSCIFFHEDKNKEVYSSRSPRSCIYTARLRNKTTIPVNGYKKKRWQLVPKNGWRLL
jgi:hypothetical protein